MFNQFDNLKSDLVKRVIGALGVILLFLVFVYLLDRRWFNVFVLFVLSLCFYEWCRLCQLRSKRWLWSSTLIFAAIGAICFFYLIPAREQSDEIYRTQILIAASLLSLAWLLIALGLVYLIGRKVVFQRNYFAQISFTARVFLLFAGVLILLPCLWFIDFVYNQAVYGQRLLMFFIGLCVISDVMAFVTGKSMGRNRLCPNISPNKTVEGVLGALFAVLLWNWTTWLNSYSQHFSVDFVFAMVAVGIFAVVGDLFESVCKRAAQVKDSGTLIYGHGGILDRIDSMIAACPIFVLILGFYL